jgi:hypothetical protein
MSAAVWNEPLESEAHSLRARRVGGALDNGNVLIVWTPSPRSEGPSPAGHGPAETV